MLARDQDFVVETKHGIIRCHPKTPAASSAFKVLQIAVSRLLQQVPDAPDVAIDVDGVIGPSVTLAVQVIAQRMSNGKHQGLAELGGLQPEQAVPAVAERAMEIAGYLQQVVEAEPAALINPQPVELADPFAALKGMFTGKRIAAIAGTLLGVAAFIGLGAMVQRRTLGLSDRSSMLPPSDGTDDFDEDAYESSHTDIDTDGAIDVEAVEVPSHAA